MATLPFPPHASVSAPAGTLANPRAPTMTATAATLANHTVVAVAAPKRRRRPRVALISVAARCRLDGPELRRPRRATHLGCEPVWRHRLHLGQQSLEHRP